MFPREHQGYEHVHKLKSMQVIGLAILHGSFYRAIRSDQKSLLKLIELL